MKIAIFSDVHGNLTALDTVLADIKKQAPDAVAFAGDLCYFGARPAACVERIRPDVDLFVYGNTDEFLFNPPPLPDGLPEERKAAIKELQAWTREKLTAAQLGWLSRLPFAHRISPTAEASDDLLIVHANPKDVNAPIAPPEDEQQEKLGKVVFEQSGGEIRPLLANVTAHTIAYGHVHFPNIQQVDGITLANISCTSLPMTRDGVARYAILTWHKGERWHIEQRRVMYNFGKEQELLSFLQPPDWEQMARGLG